MTYMLIPNMLRSADNLLGELGAFTGTEDEMTRAGALRARLEALRKGFRRVVWSDSAAGRRSASEDIMATARLINPESIDGGTAFQVEAYPFNDPSFTGPDDRDWAQFVVVADDEAMWEWRTGADKVRRAAQRLAAGIWTVERATKDQDVARWVSLHEDEFVDTFQDEEPGLADLPDSEFAAKMLLRVGQDLTNEAGLFGYYMEDDDACASEAAGALELPRWAKRNRFSAGGPGSGYTATSIVLAKGKTLRDLTKWLETRAHHDQASPAKPRRRRP